MIGILLIYGIALAGLFMTARIIRYLYITSKSPLWDLQGPPKTFNIMGNGIDSNFAETEKDFQEKIGWHRQYGSVFRFQGPLGLPILVVNDIKAINHVITHTNIFPKPAYARYILSRAVGPGVLVVEGHDHSIQRKIMNPAFGPAHIRDITDIFVEKAAQLSNILFSQIEQQPLEQKVGVHVDMVSWLSRASLDIIGLSGFGYEFNSLSNSEPTELNRALSTILSAEGNTLGKLRALVPALRLVPTYGARQVIRAQIVMNRIGHELLTQARSRILKSENDGKIKGRDLLSLLVKANLATEGAKLSDDAVIAQIPTFFVAGHEATSASTLWALFALSQAPGAQHKLREELRTAPTNPTMDDLNALPYLEKVTREVLRLYAPVIGTVRAATEDTVIPVSKPYIDRYGKTRYEIKVSKGDLIPVPILTLHRSKEIWGPNADIFDPDRWDNLPDETQQVPGIVSRLFAFLGGPRACIGYRYAMVQFKALIYALIKDFEFELAVPESDIRAITAVVQFPTIKGSEKRQLPMVVRLANY